MPLINLAIITTCKILYSKSSNTFGRKGLAPTPATHMKQSLISEHAVDFSHLYSLRYDIFLKFQVNNIYVKYIY